MTFTALSEDIDKVTFHAKDLGYHEVRPDGQCTSMRHYLLFRFNGMVEMSDVARIIGEFGFRFADNSDLAITMKKKIVDTIRASELRYGAVATYDSRPDALNRILVLSIARGGGKPEFFSIQAFPRQLGWTFLVFR